MADNQPSQPGTRLAGRRIIITGAASGIGKAMAELFHGEGAQLALFDMNGDALKPVAAQLGALPVVVDLAKLGTIAAAVARAAEHMGGIDGLVNGAALGVAKPIGETDDELLQKFLTINLAAPYHMCREALPHLRKAKGAIVNIASGQGLLSNTPNNTAYAATKGGLVSFTRALAAEVAPDVRVNAVCPGVTNTPMIAALVAGYPDMAEAPFVQQLAMKRVAEPVEIARGVMFLLSDEASFVTGVALAVDGGRTFH